MQSPSTFAWLAAGIAALAVAGASPAAANCTKLGFSVNDYGKDGPTKDAKDLLDKYIVRWAADNKVANYTVGKKDVSCELFLNFIVFDEHTCKASALVCWPDGGPAVPTSATPTKAAPARAAPAKAAPGKAATNKAAAQ